ncbi:MAG: hypothetical protein ACLFT3_05285 [Cyclobacteriaceae bacterium]
MNKAQKSLDNHIRYRKRKQLQMEERDALNISKAILNLEAIYNEVTARHLKEPNDFTRMLLENLQRPLKVLYYYQDMTDKLKRKLQYLIQLVDAGLIFLKKEQEEELTDDDQGSI